MDPINKPLRLPGRKIVLTEQMIERAIGNTRSNSEAARWLGVSYNTYKKYAKLYQLWDAHLNEAGKGISKKVLNSKYNLDDILEGKHSDYPSKKLEQRLISTGYLPSECSLCGWNEERLVDGKICIALDHIDGDDTNHKLENLRLLCPNCYFTNVGDFTNSKRFC